MTDPLTILAVGSGDSAHVRSRVRAFSERGHRMFLLTTARGDERDRDDKVTEIELSSAEARDLEPLERALGGVVERAFGARGARLVRCLHIRSVLRRVRPDVVHIHYAYGMLPWAVAAAARQPLVVTVMGGDILFDEQGTPTRIGEWLTRRLLDRADLITAKSDYLCAVLERLGGRRLASKSIKVVWGVDLSRFSRRPAGELRRRLGIPDGAPVLFSPKILQPFYGVDLIIEAVARLALRYPEVRLVVSEYCADPAYRQALAARAKELGVDGRVLFAGSIPHDEMASYYSLADLVVSVPPSDGLPQSLLEAMACETPNVLSKLDRYKEIVTHEESAYFVDRDPDAIAAGVSTLLDRPDLRRKLSARGHEIVRERADAAAEVQRLERRLVELAAGRGPRSTAISRLALLAGIFLYRYPPRPG